MSRVERGVADLPVAHFDDDGIDEDHRIERSQRAGGSLREFPVTFSMILEIVSLRTVAS